MSNDRKIRTDYLCVNDTTSKERRRRRKEKVEVYKLKMDFSSNGIWIKGTKSVFAHTF
jgi:hypothetical protein